MRKAHRANSDRRAILVGGLASMLAVVFPFMAQAAGPTLKATRVGQKVVFRGYVYTVVKSRGKLVWKQGAKVAAATATAKPSASATPTATATPTASPTPTASASGPEVSSDGVFVADSSAIKEGQTKIIDVNIAKNQYPSYSFTRLNGKIYAVSVICTHSGCKVVAEKTELICNCHYSIFNPITGDAKSGPARLPLTSYLVTERDGKIYIKP